MLQPIPLFTLAGIAGLAGCVWPIFEPTPVPMLAVLAAAAAAATSPGWRRLCLSLTVFGLASFYFHFYLTLITPSETIYKRKQFELIITENPTKTDAKARYIATSPEGWRVYLTLPRASPIEPGTLITVNGQLKRLKGPADAGQRYLLAMASRKIVGQIAYPKVINQKPAKLGVGQQLLLDSRQLFDRVNQQLFPDPQASLFAGIIAGQRSSLPADILTDFRITGLTHLIAVSGFNVAIVLQLFSNFAKRFGPKLNLVLSLLAATGFAIFTGGSASVVRASLLASLAIIAHTLGRPSSAWRLLLLTAILMALANPLVIGYDIGFQLSFAAVIGLITVAKPIEKRLTGHPGWLAEAISATCAAQITTLPILIHYFGNLSIYSLPANILVGPLIPHITALGIPLVLVNAFLPALDWLAYPVDLALRYTIEISQIVADLPYATLEPPPIPLAVWLLYYLLIFAIYRRSNSDLSEEQERKYCP